MIRLARLRLQDFRNYRRLSWQPGADGAHLSVLTGPNGSGKTNLLEAVSLLAPGRGLRQARAAEWPRRQTPGGGTPGDAARVWGIAARLEGPGGTFEIGTGQDGGTGTGRSERRGFRLDGLAPRSQADIAASLALVWLTPQMDQLFTEPASGRRRFLDRLVATLEPGHVRELAAQDNSQHQRARLLAEGRADAGWLSALEASIARHAVAATATRLSFVNRLNAALADGATGGFPPALLVLACPIADRLREGSALAAEDWLRDVQRASRTQDERTGTAGYGTGRADMALLDAATGLAADLASTGQRKAMLIGVVLGHAALIAAMRGVAPILLLDEPMVHLDRARRDALGVALLRLGGQALLTGTDRDGFEAMAGVAEFLTPRDGGLVQG